jgi:HCOMODA/2-hydroxy-3-carboxy-muconic semialdehyde decarboxylase
MNKRWGNAFGLRGLIPLTALTLGGFMLIAGQLQSDIQAQSATAEHTLEALKRDLVIATRTLVDYGFMDTQGHVSVRLDANTYLMPWRRAPAIVEESDLMVYDLDGNAADARGRELVRERPIHGEIYRARPDIQAVVHAHTESLLLWTSSNIPLRPLFSSAGFIAPSVPTFQNGNAGGGVGNAEVGRGMAQALGQNGAVLIRGHGAVVAAPTLPSLIARARALNTNAQLVAQLIAMGDTPIYITPNPRSIDTEPVWPGGNDSREWEAYQFRFEADRLGR